jgi:hypothetical protein
VLTWRYVQHHMYKSCPLHQGAPRVSNMRGSVATGISKHGESAAAGGLLIDNPRRPLHRPGPLTIRGSVTTGISKPGISGPAADLVLWHAPLVWHPGPPAPPAPARPAPARPAPARPAPARPAPKRPRLAGTDTAVQAAASMPRSPNSAQAPAGGPGMRSTAALPAAMVLATELSSSYDSGSDESSSTTSRDANIEVAAVMSPIRVANRLVGGASGSPVHNAAASMPCGPDGAQVSVGGPGMRSAGALSAAPVVASELSSPCWSGSESSSPTSSDASSEVASEPSLPAHMPIERIDAGRVEPPPPAAEPSSNAAAKATLRDLKARVETARVLLEEAVSTLDPAAVGSNAAILLLIDDLADYFPSDENALTNRLRKYKTVCMLASYAMRGLSAYARYLVKSAEARLPNFELKQRSTDRACRLVVTCHLGLLFVRLMQNSGSTRKCAL